MELRNNSKLTKDMQVRFSRSMFKKTFIKAVAIIESVSLIMIAINLAFYIEKYWISIIIGVLMLALPLTFWIVFNRTLKNTANANQGGFEEIDYEYVFDETKMTATLKYDGMSNTIATPYTDFVTIMETKDLIVFMLANQQGFFVEKSGFLSATDADALEQIIKVLPTYKKY